MKDNSSVSYDEILISGNDNELAKYMWDYDKNIVVDWREEDDLVVEGIAKKANAESLSAEYTDEELKIHFEDAEYDLPYLLLEKGRYVTIRKVQELLSNTHEIRVWRESMLSDTHSLYIKTKDWWGFMDNKFSEKMTQLFVKIDETTDFE